MPTETHINDFKINVLTKEQFNDIEEKDANQVYLITNETAGGGIPTTTAILKGDGNGNAIAATAGIDYQTPIEIEEADEVFVTTSISASSTDAEIPSAKAVYTLFSSIQNGNGVSY